MASSTRDARARNGPRCPNACENCKRRKEKCNGLQPCGRCVKRKVERQCYFGSQSYSPSRPSLDRRLRLASGTPNINEGDEDVVIDSTEGQARDPHLSVVRIPVPGISRLLRDPSRNFVFIGEYANLSFLQCIRQLITNNFGLWHASAQTGSNLTMQSGPVSQPDWLSTGKDLPMAKATVEDGQQLLDDFLWSTSCILEVLDEEEIKIKFQAWLQRPPEPRESLGAKYYLILALGAQASREFTDEQAELYFNAGRYLTMMHFIDKPAIVGVQCYLLITMFLLGASRRDAAFLNFGYAERAAHTLGIHRRNVSRVFPKAEYMARERAWKNVRTLDVFLACSLGRPMATSETRNTMTEEEYSAVAGLCHITELTFAGIYGKSIVETHVVEGISKHHQTWLSFLHDGLIHDGISLDSSWDDKQRPNIGLYHVRDGYYVTIILLTRPFLIHMVLQKCSKREQDKRPGPNLSPSASDGQETSFAYACVDSATKIISTLRNLVKYKPLPKHLPFVVNSVSVAALVVALAFFADLDQKFPLYECLWDSRNILEAFAKHDLVARLYLSVIKDLEVACRAYVADRDQPKHESRQHLMGGQFGQFEISNTNEAPEEPVMRCDVVGDINQSGPADQPNVFSELDTTDHDPLDAAYFDNSTSSDFLNGGLDWTFPDDRTYVPQQGVHHNHSHIEVDEFNFDANMQLSHQAGWHGSSRFNVPTALSSLWQQ
ncbi:hypothetical protein LTR10_019286 [Elasticomyces elasticus]|uniref:Zn(2)-C6 fungal-type domain-containing protein n=1 Tax=Exophiala sideris TaxID=1016849 RepID=A0ABR0IXD7_9EURO|nr:hypothetical protein LTR10_019286 [Elasticomyces elasticus]KAK5021964.1 hypothetical protein LTS07_010546 [Exophiala sideris]KAK5026027.1 hypothetical protein LTR13_010184 [Exophiala sideris]KAK5050714.1 hypothetical protein LTR69_010570 [Exophiala sideris]KAK5177199.1 hypothetical protein LTR44_010327 [Eurotiomycetes sp. CCFEE 6388]